MRPRPEPLVALSNASLVRGRSRVLDGVTLAIHAGDHAAIVGPNGAGKSSLVRLLTLDAHPLAAREGPPPLRLFGTARWEAGALRARMGVVSADVQSRFASGPWVSQVAALDVVLSGFFASRGVFTHHEVTAAMRERAREALRRVGVGHLAEARLDELSTGEARRVLIARALVHAPALLVLDEPTAGLDVVARHRFIEQVRHLARDGTTVLMVTQHIDEIFPEVRRVIVLAEGRILEDGPKDAVLRGPALARAFGGPLSVTEDGGYYFARPAAVGA